MGQHDIDVLIGGQVDKTFLEELREILLEIKGQGLSSTETMAVAMQNLSTLGKKTDKDLLQLIHRLIDIDRMARGLKSVALPDFSNTVVNLSKLDNVVKNMGYNTARLGTLYINLLNVVRNLGLDNTSKSFIMLSGSIDKTNTSLDKFNNLLGLNGTKNFVNDMAVATKVTNVLSKEIQSLYEVGNKVQTIRLPVFKQAAQIEYREKVQPIIRPVVQEATNIRKQYSVMPAKLVEDKELKRANVNWSPEDKSRFSDFLSLMYKVKPVQENTTLTGVSQVVQDSFKSLIHQINTVINRLPSVSGLHGFASQVVVNKAFNKYMVGDFAHNDFRLNGTVAQLLTDLKHYYPGAASSALETELLSLSKLLSSIVSSKKLLPQPTTLVKSDPDAMLDDTPSIWVHSKVADEFMAGVNNVIDDFFKYYKGLLPEKPKLAFIRTSMKGVGGYHTTLENGALVFAVQGSHVRPDMTPQQIAALSAMTARHDNRDTYKEFRVPTIAKGNIKPSQAFYAVGMHEGQHGVDSILRDLGILNVGKLKYEDYTGMSELRAMVTQLLGGSGTVKDNYQHALNEFLKQNYKDIVAKHPLTDKYFPSSIDMSSKFTIPPEVTETKIQAKKPKPPVKPNTFSSGLVLPEGGKSIKSGGTKLADVLTPSTKDPTANESAVKQHLQTLKDMGINSAKVLTDVVIPGKITPSVLKGSLESLIKQINDMQAAFKEIAAFKAFDAHVKQLDMLTGTQRNALMGLYTMLDLFRKMNTELGKLENKQILPNIPTIKNTLIGYKNAVHELIYAKEYSQRDKKSPMEELIHKIEVAAKALDKLGKSKYLIPIALKLDKDTMSLFNIFTPNAFPSILKGTTLGGKRLSGVANKWNLHLPLLEDPRAVNGPMLNEAGQYLGVSTEWANKFPTKLGKKDVPPEIMQQIQKAAVDLGVEVKRIREAIAFALIKEYAKTMTQQRNQHGTELSPIITDMYAAQWYGKHRYRKVSEEEPNVRLDSIPTSGMQQQAMLGENMKTIRQVDIPTINDKARVQLEERQKNIAESARLAAEAEKQLADASKQTSDAVKQLGDTVKQAGKQKPPADPFADFSNAVGVSSTKKPRGKKQPKDELLQEYREEEALKAKNDALAQQAKVIKKQTDSLKQQEQVVNSQTQVLKELPLITQQQKQQKQQQSKATEESAKAEGYVYEEVRQEYEDAKASRERVKQERIKLNEYLKNNTNLTGEQRQTLLRQLEELRKNLETLQKSVKDQEQILATNRTLTDAQKQQLKENITNAREQVRLTEEEIKLWRQRIEELVRTNQASKQSHSKQEQAEKESADFAQSQAHQKGRQTYSGGLHNEFTGGPDGPDGPGGPDGPKGFNFGGFNFGGMGGNNVPPINKQSFNWLGQVQQQVNDLNRHVSNLHGMFYNLRNLLTVGFAVSYFTQALEDASELERKLAIANTLLRENSDTMVSMKEKVKNMAISYGGNAIDIAKGIYNVVSSGVESKNALDVAEKLNKAAIAGATDTDTVTRAALTTRLAFGLQEKEINNILDAQFKMVDKGIGSYSEFAGSLGFVMANASSLGMTYKETYGALAFLTRQGFSASEASTRLGNILMNVTSKVDKLKEAGIELFDSNGKFVGFKQFINELKTQVEGMSNMDKTNFLQDIFYEKRTMQGVLGFVNNYKDAFNVIDYMNEESSGHLQRAFDRATDTVGHKLDILKAKMFDVWEEYYLSMERVLIPIGEKIVDQFRKIDFKKVWDDIQYSLENMKNVKLDFGNLHIDKLISPETFALLKAALEIFIAMKLVLAGFAIVTNPFIVGLVLIPTTIGLAIKAFEKLKEQYPGLIKGAEDLGNALLGVGKTIVEHIVAGLELVAQKLVELKLNSDTNALDYLNRFKNASNQYNTNAAVFINKPMGSKERDDAYRSMQKAGTEMYNLSTNLPLDKMQLLAYGINIDEVMAQHEKLASRYYYLQQNKNTMAGWQTPEDKTLLEDTIKISKEKLNPKAILGNISESIDWAEKVDKQGTMKTLAIDLVTILTDAAKKGYEWTLDTVQPLAKKVLDSIMGGILDGVKNTAKDYSIDTLKPDIYITDPYGAKYARGDEGMYAQTMQQVMDEHNQSLHDKFADRHISESTLTVMHNMRKSALTDYNKVGADIQKVSEARQKARVLLNEPGNSEQTIVALTDAQYQLGEQLDTLQRQKKGFDLGYTDLDQLTLGAFDELLQTRNDILEELEVATEDLSADYNKGSSETGRQKLKDSVKTLQTQLDFITKELMRAVINPAQAASIEAIYYDEVLKNAGGGMSLPQLRSSLLSTGTLNGELLYGQYEDILVDTGDSELVKQRRLKTPKVYEDPSRRFFESTHPSDAYTWNAKKSTWKEREMYDAESEDYYKELQSKLSKELQDDLKTLSGSITNFTNSLTKLFNGKANEFTALLGGLSTIGTGALDMITRYKQYETAQQSLTPGDQFGSFVNTAAMGLDMASTSVSIVTTAIDAFNSFSAQQDAEFQASVAASNQQLEVLLGIESNTSDLVKYYESSKNIVQTPENIAKMQSTYKSVQQQLLNNAGSIISPLSVNEWSWAVPVLGLKSGSSGTEDLSTMLKNARQYYTSNVPVKDSYSAGIKYDKMSLTEQLDIVKQYLQYERNSTPYDHYDSNTDTVIKQIESFQKTIGSFDTAANNYAKNVVLNKFSGMNLSSKDEFIKQGEDYIKNVLSGTDASQEVKDSLEKQLKELFVDTANLIPTTSMLQSLDTDLAIALMNGKTAADALNDSLSNVFKTMTQNALVRRFSDSLATFMNDGEQVISKAMDELATTGNLKIETIQPLITMLKDPTLLKALEDGDSLLTGIKEALKGQGVDIKILDKVFPDTALEQVKSDLSNAVNAGLTDFNYETFTKSFGESLYNSAKDALIAAFMDTKLAKSLIDKYVVTEEVKKQLDSATTVKEAYDIMQKALEDYRNKLDIQGLSPNDNNLTNSVNYQLNKDNSGASLTGQGATIINKNYNVSVQADSIYGDTQEALIRKVLLQLKSYEETETN